MPDRATIEAATPKCLGPVTFPGWEDACGRPMTWDHGGESWRCRHHGPRAQPATTAE